MILDKAALRLIPYDCRDAPKAAVHFKKDQTLQVETAQALAQMILAAQRAMMVSEGTGE